MGGNEDGRYAGKFDALIARRIGRILPCLPARDKNRMS
ncbi:hypothetical protein CBM2634_P30012 [Cupriavidus taiwanensis]|uniref:Uncharacterized protein n=1 Tax=Cupriavidus taiwanensis TaxID=164546 RepID=A0A375JAY5_9BURK|nr:hypothetical protein CBM2634_P30012 [Cupriavidus taiwanensis]